MTNTAIKKFAFDVGQVFTASIIVLVLGLPLNMILARFLGVSGYGLYSLVVAIFAIITLTGDIGTAGAIIKYIAEYKEDKSKLYSLVSCATINLLLIGSGISIAIVILSNPIAYLFNKPLLASLLRIFSISIPFTLLNGLFLGVFNGLRKMKLYSFVLVFAKVTTIAFVTLLLYLNFGVQGAIFGFVMASIVEMVVLLILLRDFIAHFTFSVNTHIQTTKKLASFGSKLFLTNLIGMINMKASIFIIGYFLLDKDVGFFALALLFTNVLFVIPTSIQKITYPATSEYYSNQQHTKIEKMINMSMRYSLILLSIAGILLIFFGNDVISIVFGSSFLPAVTPLRVLIIGMIFYGATASVGGSFAGIGRPDIALKIGIFRTIVNLALLYLLVPLYGITGAAIATIAYQIAATVISIFLLIRILEIKIESSPFIKIALTCLIVFLLVIFLSKFINYYILAILTILLYISILRITNVFTRKDIELLTDTLRR